MDESNLTITPYRRPMPSGLRSAWRARVRCALVVVLASLVTACASVPMGTMWKMRNVGPEQLARLDPAQIRVATRIEPDGLRIAAGKTVLQLTLTLRGSGEVTQHALTVEEIQSFTSSLTGGDLGGWQAFRLDAAGLAAYERLKPVMALGRDQFEKAAFALNFGSEGELPADVDAIVVSARLQLADDQDAVTLIDRARIEVERD